MLGQLLPALQFSCNKVKLWKGRIQNLKRENLFRSFHPHCFHMWTSPSGVKQKLGHPGGFTHCIAALMWFDGDKLWTYILWPKISVYKSVSRWLLPTFYVHRGELFNKGLTNTFSDMAEQQWCTTENLVHPVHQRMGRQRVWCIPGMTRRPSAHDPC